MSKAQDRAKKLNFCIFRLKGICATLQNIGDTLYEEGIIVPSQAICNDVEFCINIIKEKQHEHK
jgi:hypothetical protein